MPRHRDNLLFSFHPTRSPNLRLEASRAPRTTATTQQKVSSRHRWHHVCVTGSHATMTVSPPRQIPPFREIILSLPNLRRVH
jgi:hypothetical protein